MTSSPDHADPTRRSPSPDPDPATTEEPDVGDSGRGAGATPPESNQATAPASSHTSPQAPPASSPPKSRAVLIVAMVAIAALLGLVFLGYAVGLIS